MTRKVNTVNRGRASHYVNGAQPLKMGFSRDLARLKFNRTYVCKTDEVKRLKDELAAEKAKGKVVDNTELTNERKDDFDGTFTATTGASTEAQAGPRDSLAKQLKVKTQALIDNETELDNERSAEFEGNVGDTGRESLAKQLEDKNTELTTKTQELTTKTQELAHERNATFVGNVGDTGRESLAKQLADERDFTQQTPINNLSPFTMNTTYNFPKQDATHDAVNFKAIFLPTSSASTSAGNWSNGEAFSYNVDFITEPNNDGDFWFISAPLNKNIKKIFGIKMRLNMTANPPALIVPEEEAVSYWGSNAAFQHNYTEEQLVAILENPGGNTTLTDSSGIEVEGNGEDWRRKGGLGTFPSTLGYNMIIYDYTTFKK